LTRGGPTSPRTKVLNRIMMTTTREENKLGNRPSDALSTLKTITAD
jgi:hypothetical protein